MSRSRLLLFFVGRSPFLLTPSIFETRSLFSRDSSSHFGDPFSLFRSLFSSPLKDVLTTASLLPLRLPTHIPIETEWFFS